MAITSMPLVAPGDTITSAGWNVITANISLLDGRTGGDPGAADKLLIASGALGAAWSQLTLAVIPNGLITDGKLAAGIDADTLNGRSQGSGAGQIPNLDGGGQVADAVHATNANNATTVATRSVGTGAGEVAFYNGGGRVVAAALADTANDSSALQSVTWKAPLVAGAFPSQVLTTSYADVAGLSVSLNRTGTWLLLATMRFLWDPAGGDASQLGNTDMTVNGAEVVFAGDVRFANAGTDQDTTMFMQTVTIASQPQTASVRAKKSGGSGSAQARSGQIVAIWCAP